MGSNMTGGIFLVLLIILCLLLLYFLPSFIAFNRGLRNRWALFLLNFFLGATLVGWVVSLVWAFVERPEDEYRSEDGNKPTRDLRFQSEPPARDLRLCPECGETILAVAKRCKHCQADLRASAAPDATGTETKQSPELPPLSLSAFRSSRVSSEGNESTTKRLWVGVVVVAVLAIAVTAIWGQSLTPRIKALFGGPPEHEASHEELSAARAKIKKLMTKVDVVERGVSDYYFLKGRMPTSCSQVSGYVEGTSIGADGRIVLDLNVTGAREVAGKSIVVVPSLIGRKEIKWRCTTNTEFRYVPAECRNVLPQLSIESVRT